MLHEVLDKKACAQCRFCCSFRRQSLWELPVFTQDLILDHRTSEIVRYFMNDVNGDPVEYEFREENGEKYCVTDLVGKYETDDPEEEVRCPFLDEKNGCILPEDYKPFDCKIWPLRILEMPDGELKIALTLSCPEMRSVPLERLQKLVADGLGDVIRRYASEHPAMIKKYKEGYLILD